MRYEVERQAIGAAEVSQVIEIECPFCDRPVTMELAEFQASSAHVSCGGCGVEVALCETSSELALAA